jgi:hypothetical protein
MINETQYQEKNMASKKPPKIKTGVFIETKSLKSQTYREKMIRSVTSRSIKDLTAQIIPQRGVTSIKQQARRC